MCSSDAYHIEDNTFNKAHIKKLHQNNDAAFFKNTWANYLLLARSALAMISFLATSTEFQPVTFTHLPSSKSL